MICSASSHTPGSNTHSSGLRTGKQQNHRVSINPLHMHHICNLVRLSENILLAVGLSDLPPVLQLLPHGIGSH